VSTCLLAVTIGTFVYRLAVGALNLSQFVPTDFEQVIKIEFRGMDYYSKPLSDSNAGLISYYVNLIANSTKASLVGNLTATIALALLQKW